MAGEELVRGNSLIGGGTAVRVAPGQQNISQRHQKDVVLDRCALSGDGAFEEGGKKRIEWLHSFGCPRRWVQMAAASSRDLARAAQRPVWCDKGEFGYNFALYLEG